jgi:glycosyltransferase involved in cell wall biosynthesis
MCNEMPLVTFALLAYNQENFIEEAIKGAFAQTYSPLQIIISDDCSTDKTFEIAIKMVHEYKGKHEVLLNRNDNNLGIGCHVNRIMDLAKGEWIVGAAGDDISLSHRTAEIIDAVMKSSGRPLSAWSRAQLMTAEGKLLNKFVFSDGRRHTLKEMISNERNVWGCSHAWHRDIFLLFGPLNNNVLYEDNALSFRSYLAGDIVYVDNTLVLYRNHDQSISNHNKIQDKLAFYNYVAKVYSYFLVGFLQRLTDLGVFEMRVTSGRKDIFKMKQLIIGEYKKYLLRMKLFNSFPSFNVGVMLRLLNDSGMYKYIYRCISYRLLR